MSRPSIVEVVKSVLAAAIGVQSDKNRQKDFSQGSLPIYLTKITSSLAALVDPQAASYDG